jgi:hypothetical protein
MHGAGLVMQPEPMTLWRPPGIELLARAAHGKSLTLGPAGEMGVVGAWLRF